MNLQGPEELSSIGDGILPKYNTVHYLRYGYVDDLSGTMR